ncbi:MAG: GHMP kinase [Chloroflexi bacterium]|nr:MAG: GHMP kinase [Chloroflexota bacterium]
MLIARAPLRLSFAGGGTDLEAYYGKYGGAVVSTSIDKYSYVIVSLNDAPYIQVSSSDYQTFYRQGFEGALLWETDLSLPKVVIDHFGIQSGISVFLASQVPPGTGLGSSSTLAVALIKAMSVLCDISMTQHEIAQLACHIEIDKLGTPIGRQDQYAAAYGGLNYMEFTAEGVKVEPLQLAHELTTELQRRLMLFFTGRSRSSAEILVEQKRNSERNRATVINALHVIKRAALRLRDELLRGNIQAIGECLDVSWAAKRQLAAGITDPWIDQWYGAALRAGASGGKISGAGGGGFMLLYCEPEFQRRVTATLQALGLMPMDFRLASGGAMVIVNTMYAHALSNARHD